MSQTEVVIEETPNPQSMKFTVNKEIAENNFSFANSQEAFSSPLASKIFGFPWTESVFIGSNYVTITKQDWVEWEVLAEPLADLIKEHIEDGTPVVMPQETQIEDGNDSPVVQQIKKILNEEVRPAVAMDGGDIVFSKYENNIVYVYMQGACAGCPSSTYTLKEGIETRLKAAIPEIQEVVSL